MKRGIMILAALAVSELAFAACQGGGGGGAANLGAMATQITQSFAGFGKLMIGVSYLAGIGFGISAIFKFKAHKDNPTQVPIGTPFSLMAISVALVFLPGFYKPASGTIGISESGGFTGSGACAVTKAK